MVRVRVRVRGRVRVGVRVRVRVRAPRLTMPAAPPASCISDASYLVRVRGYGLGLGVR